MENTRFCCQKKYSGPIFSNRFFNMPSFGRYRVPTLKAPGDMFQYNKIRPHTTILLAPWELRSEMYCPCRQGHRNSSLRPRFLPREFGQLFVTVVYIPPNANTDRPSSIIHDQMKPSIYFTEMWRTPTNRSRNPQLQDRIIMWSVLFQQTLRSEKAIVKSVKS